MLSMALTNPKLKEVLGESQKNIYYHLHSFVAVLVPGWQELLFTTRPENGTLKQFGS